MAAKDLYSEKKKEKSLYSTYNTATPRTQSTLKNSGWDAGQSAAPVQSNAVQKVKREKSPSELGEEVIRAMLEEDAPKERQRQTAAGSTAQYNSSTTGTKAAGSKKASMYSGAATAPYTGNAAGRFGGAASYSSPPAAKPAAGNQNAAPYGGAAMAQYSRQAAGEPAIQKREKTPSELGDEVVAQVLVEEGLMDPKELEEYLAGFEEPSAQTFADAGGSDIMGRGANRLYSMQRNNRPISPLQTPGGKFDPIYTAFTRQPLTAAQYPATVRFDESDPDGSQYGDSIYGLDENGSSSDAISEEPGISMQDIATVGTGNYMLPASIWLGNQLKQLVEDTHIAEGLSVPLYWIDRGVNGGESFLEGIWNYGIDLVEAGTDFNLEQQKQQAQEWAFLGGPFQDHANFISDNVQIAQEKLPELAEYFRRHEAAKHAQEIEEMYDAGGLIKIGGDIFSGGGQVGLAGLISAATGGVGGLLALGASAAGNAATDARAGGASEEMAFVYGNLIGLIEVGTELLSGGIPWLPKGLLDNVLADVVETNMGRVAWKAAQDALGEGAEEFISTMAEAYLAKLWNGDERDAWQTFEETFPDALYAAFQGAATSTIMCAPENISNIQYARALDAALDVINNGGTPSDAEIAAANASLQYLTNNWGKDSKWSQNANGQWGSEWNKHFGVFFPPIGSLAPNAMDVQEPGIETQDVETDAQIDRAEQASDETAPESEALPNEENHDMLSKEEREALGRAWVLIPHIPSSLLNENQQTYLREACRRILRFAADIPRDAEVTMLYHMDMTPIEENGIIVGEPGAGSVEYTAPNEPFISIHNHSDGRTFSEEDIKSFLSSDNYKIMVAVGHNGQVYVLEKHSEFNSAAAWDLFDNLLEQYPNRTESAEAYITWMEEYVIKGVEQYGASYYSG